MSHALPVPKIRLEPNGKFCIVRPDGTKWHQTFDDREHACATLLACFKVAHISMEDSDRKLRDALQIAGYSMNYQPEEELNG